VAEQSNASGVRRFSWLWIGLFIGGSLVVLAGLLYGIGYRLVGGGVLPHTTVAGVSVGGLSPAAAQAKLASGLASRGDAPIAVKAGGQSFTVDPATAGLTIDTRATLAAGGHRDAAPAAIWKALFAHPVLNPAVAVDTAKLDAAVTAINAKLVGGGHDGSIVFHGVTPVAVAPVQGIEIVHDQALAVLSLDIDGTGFEAVGERDPVIARLQKTHHAMRPVLFHSPYEAACNFVIGQRISIAQARALRQRMGAESGDSVAVDGVTFHAFPRPQQLLELTEVRGLPDEKLLRIHGIAHAALDGVLDRRRLRALPVETALAEVSALRGVGPFSAQGIVFRGAGVVDEITDDAVGKQAVERLYELDHLPGQAEMLRLAEAWAPFRMWCLVLLHVWIRGEGGGPAPLRLRQRGRRTG